MQFVHRDAMTPRQLVQVADVGVDVGVAGRIEVDVAGVVGEALSGFFDLDVGIGQQLGDRVQARVEFGQRVQLAARAAEKALDRKFAVAVQQFVDVAAAFEQASGVGQALVVVFELGQRVRRSEERRVGKECRSRGAGYRRARKKTNDCVRGKQ